MLLTCFSLQEEKRRQKEREDEMNRNIAYLSLLEKHERAMKNRSRMATHEQFVRIFPRFIIVRSFARSFIHLTIHAFLPFMYLFIFS